MSHSGITNHNQFFTSYTFDQLLSGKYFAPCPKLENLFTSDLLTNDELDYGKLIVRLGYCLGEAKSWGTLEVRYPFNPKTGEVVVAFNDTSGASWVDDISTLFASREAIQWVLLLSGVCCYLLKRDKWESRRYLTFHIPTLVGQSSGIQGIAGALLHRKSFGEESRHRYYDEIVERSHRCDTALVVKLTDQVRTVVESLGNLFANHHAAKVRQNSLEENQQLAQELFEACLVWVFNALLPLFYEVQTDARGLDIPSLNRSRVKLLETIPQATLNEQIRPLVSTFRQLSGVTLGQLGAIYEGLQAYNAFFTAEEVYEVKPRGFATNDGTRRSLYVSQDYLSDYSNEERVYISQGEDRVPKKYEQGSFILRLSMRERQAAGSFYTPHCLTESVVKYALRPLAQQYSADQLLHLTLCEPAVGSGAFLVEAVNQLSALYLSKKQKETNQVISSKCYSHELEKVKRYITVNRCCGVDVNELGLALASSSLRINASCVAQDEAKGLVLGNSLIGVNRSIYNSHQLHSGTYPPKPPGHLGVGPHWETLPAGGIYYFLLPHPEMTPVHKERAIKQNFPDEVAEFAKWRRGLNKPFNTEELDLLARLSRWIDSLWKTLRDRAVTMLSEMPRVDDLWGQRGPLPTGAPLVEDCLEREKLAMIMDYWCSLWFWPVEQSHLLPTRAEYLKDIEDLLDKNCLELIRDNPRVSLVRQIADEMKFLHWELTYLPVFATKGGFDLILGNPPWVQPDWEEREVLADYYPELALRKYSAANVSKAREKYLKRFGARRLYLKQCVLKKGLRAFLHASINYPLLKGTRTNYYKCFITKGWEISSTEAVMGLIHPDSVFEDPRGGVLRKALYPRLKYHFQFANELRLFYGVHHQFAFSINIYKNSTSGKVGFDHLANLFHPHTIDKCYQGRADGSVPGIKHQRTWDTRGHKRRIVQINDDRLTLLNELCETKSSDFLTTRLISLHSNDLFGVLEKFAKQTSLHEWVGGFFTTQMWNETKHQSKGIIRRRTKFPTQACQWILSGPHIFVGSAFYKTPKEDCTSNLDYLTIDLPTISSDFLPRTNYVPGVDKKQYQKAVPVVCGEPVTNYYRLAFRAMIGSSSERSLIGAIIPPQVGHINGLRTYLISDYKLLVTYATLCCSIVYDFYVKATGKTNLHELPSQLPVSIQPEYESAVVRRGLLLNCLTQHYSSLWEELWDDNFNWSRDHHLLETRSRGGGWTWESPLRDDYQRRQALVEIDALAALNLGLSIDELINLYQVHFPVLKQYEQDRMYDQSGRLVPKQVAQCTEKTRFKDPKLYPEQEREYTPPYVTCNREKDLIAAYHYFERSK